MLPDAPPGIALWLPKGMTAAIGLAQNPELELEIEAMRHDGVGLVRRQSGGGAVLLYEGVLCWEAYANLRDLEKLGGSGIRQTYRILSQPIVRALSSLGLEVFNAGICDLSTNVNGKTRKLAGTAQLRRKDKALVHGSLLVSSDVEMLSAYLKFPSDQPDYRQGRRHRDFCLSVLEAVDGDAETLMSRLTDAIVGALDELKMQLLPLPSQLPPEAAALEAGKYNNNAWNWSRARMENRHD